MWFYFFAKSTEGTVIHSRCGIGRLIEVLGVGAHPSMERKNATTERRPCWLLLGGQVYAGRGMQLGGMWLKRLAVTFLLGTGRSLLRVLQRSLLQICFSHQPSLGSGPCCLAHAPLYTAHDWARLATGGLVPSWGVARHEAPPCSHHGVSLARERLPR